MEKKSNLSHAVLLSIFACVFCFYSDGFAENRALIIGVGKYRQPAYDTLNGIDLDVEMMREVAGLMGFRPGQVKVLEDDRATLANVEHAMETWLVNGAGPDDRIFIYFSGHGTFVPDENKDEEDNADEALCLYDTQAVTRNGQDTLDGVLVDDRFNAFLDRMRSKDILVVLDSCHSGTATKSIPLNPRSIPVKDAQPKLFSYPGMPTGHKGSFLPAKRERGSGATRAGTDNFVCLSACEDDEQSLATTQGSLFTIGFRTAVRQAAVFAGQGDRSLSVRAWWWRF